MGGKRGRGLMPARRRLWPLLLLVVLGAALAGALGVADVGAGQDGETLAPSSSWREILTPEVWLASCILLVFSAFFSASEVAFYSLHQVRLRAMRESGRTFESLVARLMDHPGNLLTSILMGNCIVNVLLGVILAARVEEALAAFAHPVVSYSLAVVLTTAALVFFGEITPKLMVVRNGETFACFAALPIYTVDRLLAPVRDGLIVFIGFLFRVTRFSEVRPAAFMTDAEFKSLLSEGEASGVIEEDERQMIQGILEFSDVMVREIKVPRPDMVVLQETASVGEALELLREHEFARVPVYGENLDDIVGVLFAKDLLPSVVQGEFEKPAKPFLRKVQFVPETMSVADFVKTAQHLRTHLAIVVDEFGGTEGLVTLQDALREVVGDIGEEDGGEGPGYEIVGDGVYRVEGGFPLDELEDMTGSALENGDHTTVGGLIMERSERMPEVGDHIEYQGVGYTVEAIEGKRVSQVLIEVPKPSERERES